MSHNRGERNPARKLTENDVRNIRFLRTLGFPRKLVAQKYSVGEYTIRDITEGRTWGWLT